MNSDDLDHLKQCERCKVSKPHEEFVVMSDCEFKYQSVCRDCFYKLPEGDLNQKVEQYLIGKRASRLSRKYGMKHADYIRLFADCRGLCEICHEPGRSVKTLVIDHCHKTRKVRGLICKNCNVGLGFLKDDLPTLLRVVRYFIKGSPAMKQMAIRFLESTN